MFVCSILTRAHEVSGLFKCLSEKVISVGIIGSLIDDDFKWRNRLKRTTKIDECESGTVVGPKLPRILSEDLSELLERDQLTSGTTWHAAGLMVTFGSTSETSTSMRKYTKELYSKILEEETGLQTGFLPVGFIEVATNEDYLEEYRRTAAFNRMCGVDVHEIGPEEVQRLFPMSRVDDVLAGFYVEDDGRVNPVDATTAFAKGARGKGAQIVEGVAATGVTSEGGRVTGVTTDKGTQ